MVDFFTMTVSDTIDDLADTIFSLHAVLSVVGHDVVFITCTTFNTSVWTSGDDIFPVVEVITRLGASADAWVI
jgi:hypothetical protein